MELFNQTLAEFTTTLLFHYFLVFCRLGAAMMVLPGFGEIYVNARTRLMVALAVTVVMEPVLESSLPPPPEGVLEAMLVILPEILIGLFIGGIGRLLQGILHIAGMIIAFQSSLASALLFDANQGSQGSVMGNFMTIAGLTALFTSGLHHLMLHGVSDSYQLFHAGKFPPIDDFAHLATHTLSDGFVVAFKIASPLIISGLLLYLGAGILGRLMPTMQVFFVMLPLQLYKSFVIFMMIFAVSMMWYINYFAETMSTFTVMP